MGRSRKSRSRSSRSRSRSRRSRSTSRTTRSRTPGSQRKSYSSKRSRRRSGSSSSSSSSSRSRGTSRSSSSSTSRSRSRNSRSRSKRTRRSRTRNSESPILRRNSVPSPVSLKPKRKNSRSRSRSRSRTRTRSPSRKPHRRIRDKEPNSPILKRNNVPSPPRHKPEKLPPGIRKTSSTVTTVPEPKVNPKIIKMKAENRNPISILNEMYPMNIGPVPVYECSAVNTGQPNRSVYHVTCKLEGYTYVGVGRTKKDAKTDAAFKVLEDLNALDDEYYDEEDLTH